MSKLGSRSAVYGDIVHHNAGQTENLSIAPVPSGCSGKPIIAETFRLPANKKLCVDNHWQEFLWKKKKKSNSHNEGLIYC